MTHRPGKNEPMKIASVSAIPMSAPVPKEKRHRTDLGTKVESDATLIRVETDDGLTGEEGTFTICSFWLVSALVEIGELDRARGLCEKLLSFASPLALYAEEIDAATGRHLGNFPQAFTHLAQINAVVHILRAEEQAQARAMAGDFELDEHGARR